MVLGIRFVIFMQGCPLKCLYCHNRDTWDIKSGIEVSVPEIIAQIMRSKPYIDSSHGGVTVSGGEPLLQPKFVTALFKELKKLGIHTALDTAGSLPIENTIKELLNYTDLVILDIKHINNQKSIHLVGAPNKNNLDFAKYLSKHHIPMWIRQVIIPGYTDDEKDLKTLKAFIDTLESVEKVEILPYHDLGKFKWKEIGDTYALESVKAPTQEQLDAIKKILNIP